MSRKTAKNSLILTVVRILGPACSLLLVMVLSRRLGVEGLGRYVIANSLLYVCAAPALLGLPALIPREGAGNRPGLVRVLREASTLAGVAALLMTGVMAASAFVLDYEPATRAAVLILACAVLPQTWFSLLESAAVAEERTEHLLAASLAEHALKVMGGIGLLLAGHGLAGVLWAAVAGRWAACGVLGVLLRRDGVGLGASWNTAGLRRLAAEIPTFATISIFATLYWRLDMLMLSRLAPLEAAGLYGAAWRVLSVAMILPQSISLAFYPRLVRQYREGPSKLEALAEPALRYLTALAIPMACCAPFVAGEGLALLAGEPFRAAATTVSILLWTLVPFCLVRFHAHLLVAAHLQRVDMLLNVAMSVANLALNLVFIPRWGHVGAATATLASMTLYALVQLVCVHRLLPAYRTPLLPSPGVAVGSAVAAGVTWWLSDLPLPVAIGVPVVVYGAILLAGGTIRREELDGLVPGRLLARRG